MEKKIFIIVLNYNGYEDTLECLDSLKNIEYDNYKIIVVDNASTDESVGTLRERVSDDVILIESKTNLGYAGGNNIGIKYALDNGADYLCILNNDTIVSTDFLKKLVNFSEENPRCGMVGPAILEFDEPEIIQSTGAQINMSRGNVPPINDRKHINEVNTIISCDYIGGACILVRREVIDSIGMIPENYFLFYEETEWCYLAKKDNYIINCLTNAHIYHKGSNSINKIKGLSKYLMFRNRVVFVKRNGTFSEKISFTIYLMLKMIQTILFDYKNVEEIKFYMHGFFNRIDKEKYPFIIIKR